MAETPQFPRVVYQGSAAGTLGPFDLAVDGTPWSFSDGEITVTRYATEDATSGTVLVEGTDFDVSGGSGSGQVTLTSPQTGLLEAERLLIERNTSLSQDYDNSVSQRISSATIMAAHDKAVRQIQDLNAQIQRLIDAAGGGLTPSFSSDGTTSSASTGTTTTTVITTTSLQSGAGYRENHDGKYTMWGQATLLAAGNVTVGLPLVLATSDYQVLLGANGENATWSAKTNIGFTLSAPAAAVIDWMVEGVEI